MANNPGLIVTVNNKSETQDIFKNQFPNHARFAIANTASRVAFEGVKRAENKMRNDFILRNNYLVSSAPGRGAVKFNRAIPHHNISLINSSWGSPDKIGARDYSFLEDQETGFTHYGVVPTQQARISKSQRKRIKRINYLQGMNIRKPDDIGSISSQNAMGKTWAMLRKAYRDGFGLPGSKQFFYLEKSELPGGMTSGFYQFKRSTPSGDNDFPEWKKIYHDVDNSRRKAVHWMEESKNTFTQSDIDKIFTEEARKSFTRQINRRW